MAYVNESSDSEDDALNKLVSNPDATIVSFLKKSNVQYFNPIDDYSSHLTPFLSFDHTPSPPSRL